MIPLQKKYQRTGGFTLVEVMVVILIISILLALGNYGDLSQRRERARLEEIAVQIISLVDQEKTNTLLGKTENGAIVRKRKVTINTEDVPSEGVKQLNYTSYADLAEDNEDSYCGITGGSPVEECPLGSPANNNKPIISKSWKLYEPTLEMKVYDCDNGTNEITPMPGVSIVFQGDNLSFLEPAITAKKHLVIFLSRDTTYREIHIDRRTGVTYERESLTNTPSCT